MRKIDKNKKEVFDNLQGINMQLKTQVEKVVNQERTKSNNLSNKIFSFWKRYSRNNKSKQFSFKNSCSKSL